MQGICILIDNTPGQIASILIKTWNSGKPTVTAELEHLSNKMRIFFAPHVSAEFNQAPQRMSGNYRND